MRYWVMSDDISVMSDEWAFFFLQTAPKSSTCTKNLLVLGLVYYI